MNRLVYSATRITVVASLLAIAMPSIVSAADYVDCASINSQINADAAEELKRQSAIYDKLREQPSWLTDSDGLMTACSNNNWPKVKLSNPILTDLISGVQERAVKEACNKARQTIAAGESTYDQLVGNAGDGFAKWSDQLIPPSTGSLDWGSVVGGIDIPGAIDIPPVTGIPGVTPQP